MNIGKGRLGRKRNGWEAEKDRLGRDRWEGREEEKRNRRVREEEWEEKKGGGWDEEMREIGKG